MKPPISDKERRRHQAQQRMMRNWKAYHQEQREAVLNGPHGVMLSELFRMFDHLQHVRPEQMIGMVKSIDWPTIDADTKFTVVHEVGVAISKFRTRRGLDAFDDALPGQPDGPYRTIRAIVLDL
jgi:hypothetical protein